MSNSPRLAAAYVRVSTEDQTELSPDTQVQKIRDYAKNHGYFIPDEFIYHDDGISGRSVKKRFGFNQMIAAAKADPRPFDAILVWKFSRFARNREDSIVYKSMLKKRGIDVISVSEDVGDDKMSILIESLIEAMDEYYSVNLSEEVVRGMTEKVRRGQAVSIPPLGYRIEKGKFYIDEETAPLVRRIFDEYLHGKPSRAIAMGLNRDGYRTRRGNLFENRTVQYILENPVYGGFIRWDIDGKGSRGFYRDGKATIVKGEHEPYFDAQTYALIQEHLAEQQKQHQKYMRHSSQTNSFALRGLVRCSACGSTLCMASNHISLQCHAYSHGKCSVSHCISLSKINEAVIEALKYDLQNSELQIEFTTPKVSGAVDFEKELKRENDKLERVKRAYMAGIDSLQEYQENKAVISATIAEIQKKQRAVSKIDAEQAQKDLKAKIKSALALLESPTASEDEKNASLRSFIKKIVFSRPTSQVIIYYYI